MRPRVADDNDPGAAARAVMPIFALTARRIVALVDIFCHCVLGHLRRAGPLNVRIAKIGELLGVASSAIGAGEAHFMKSRESSMKVRLGADAFFVDDMASRE